MGERIPTKGRFRKRIKQILRDSVEREAPTNLAEADAEMERTYNEIADAIHEYMKFYTRQYMIEAMAIYIPTLTIVGSSPSGPVAGTITETTPAFVLMPDGVVAAEDERED